MEATSAPHSQRVHGEMTWYEALSERAFRWSERGVKLTLVELESLPLSDESRPTALSERERPLTDHGLLASEQSEALSPIALVITVCRPEVRNALDLKAIESLVEISDMLNASERLPSSLILTGAGGHFVAGGDLKALSRAESASIAGEVFDLMATALCRLRGLSCPFIIAAEGVAVGGGAELLIAGDLRVVSSSLSVRFAQVSLGLCTGWGGAQRLVELMGRQRALALLLGGESLTAARCLEIGIAHRVTAEGGALEGALQWALALAQVPSAVSAVKALLADESETAFGALVARRERMTFPELWRGDEHWDAVQRFWDAHAQKRERLALSGKDRPKAEGRREG